MNIVELHARLVATGGSNRYERLLFNLLKPIAFLYGIIGWCRNRCYDFGWFSAYQSALPVISVGNIAVGGTGKTPVVDWLVKQLVQQGKRPAIISRGYSGSFAGDAGVVSSADGLLMSAAECGDEPYLLARRNRQCLVIVAKKRIVGIKAVEIRGDIDVVILDDGFQHRAVKRTVDLVLLDTNKPLGNGWPLPAGNLREFSPSLQRADYILMTRSKQKRSELHFGYRPFYSCHKLASLAVDLDGNTLPVAKFTGLKLLAFAGIANPESFFSSLSDIGIIPESKLAFADHDGYNKSTLAQIRTAAVSVDALITTEKDGVKLRADMFDLPCYQIGMDIEIESGEELFGKISTKLWS